MTIDGALPEADEHDELDAAGDIGVLKPSLVQASTGPKKSGRAVRIAEQPALQENKFRKTQERPFSAAEVMELRRELKRLADEYKVRGSEGEESFFFACGVT